MKKMLVKCLSIASLLVFTSTAFAAYQVTVEPTDVALSNHAKTKSLKANGLFTDIIIVNYSPTSVVLAYPAPLRLFTESTSGRITSFDRGGLWTVVLRQPDATGGQEIWRSDHVGAFDTISVYLVDNKYIVYDNN